MSVRLVAMILWAVSAAMASAQGFAGLGQSAEGYTLPDETTRFDFPIDHGAHPEFRIEWWYVTANVTGPDGSEFGIQWTLFRNALAPTGAEKDQLWMGHAAVSSPEGHFHAERFARGGTGQAEVRATPFIARIDEWQMKGDDLSNVTIFAQGADFSYDIQLRADLPFVPQGKNGYSAKSENGFASMYYSQPFYRVEGTLTLPGGDVAVKGVGWLDREWSSQPLTATQTGWDWVSLHLDDGDKLMGYRLRDADGSDYTVGTWVHSDGTPEPLSANELSMVGIRSARVAGRDVPVTWSITLPARGLSLSVEAIYPDSWMPTAIPYWEGPVRVSGSHSGVGYLEMTGYE